MVTDDNLDLWGSGVTKEVNPRSLVSLYLPRCNFLWGNRQQQEALIKAPHSGSFKGIVLCFVYIHFVFLDFKYDMMFGRKL